MIDDLTMIDYLAVPCGVCCSYLFPFGVIHVLPLFSFFISGLAVVSRWLMEAFVVCSVLFFVFDSGLLCSLLVTRYLDPPRP